MRQFSASQLHIWAVVNDKYAYKKRWYRLQNRSVHLNKLQFQTPSINFFFGDFLFEAPNWYSGLLIFFVGQLYLETHISYLISSWIIFFEICKNFQKISQLKDRMILHLNPTVFYSLSMASLDLHLLCWYHHPGFLDLLAEYLQMMFEMTFNRLTED